MALTNFGALQPEQKSVWQREVWEAARDQMFVSRFMGSDDNNVIQRITELTKTEKGEKVIMTLLADLVGDGTVGDDEREGNEEALQTYYANVKVDLLSHGVRSKGKMAEQKTTVNFRKSGKSRLSYWLANRVDQLTFLTMSGIDYGYNLDGTVRTDGAFKRLSFAADIVAPSANRSVNWDGGALTPGNTATITNAHVLSYKALTEINMFAKENYIKPLVADGKEYYCLFVRPGTLAQLKQDQDFQRAVVTALPRGLDNPFFSGATVTVDGLVIHEHRLVYTNKKAGAGNMWGAGGNVQGTRTLLCGAQAVGFADLGQPEWNEKEFQYGSSAGINVDKMFGLVKPRFYSIYNKSVEDFGILAINHYAK